MRRVVFVMVIRRVSVNQEPTLAQKCAALREEYRQRLRDIDLTVQEELRNLDTRMKLGIGEGY